MAILAGCDADSCANNLSGQCGLGEDEGITIDDSGECDQYVNDALDDAAE